MQLMIILSSSVCPAPQKMILTIDTCTAAVYIFNLIPAYLSLTITRYLAGNLLFYVSRYLFRPYIAFCHRFEKYMFSWTCILTFVLFALTCLHLLRLAYFLKKRMQQKTKCVQVHKEVANTLK
jgi:hypothetical protein